MIGPWPCAYACAYVDPVFTGQSYDKSISTSTRRTNLSVFLVLMLMCYVAVVFTCLHMRLCVCLCLCASEKRGLIQQRQQQQLYFTLKSLEVIKKGRRSISEHNPQLA